jgi:carboxyl-terminal processing protease
MKNPRRTRAAVLLLAGVAAATFFLAAGLANRSAYRYLGVFQEVWGLTRANYVEPVDESALLDGALRGMVGALDGASAYLAPGEEKALAAPPGPGRPGMETLPAGGAQVIVRVDPNGPASRAGLEVGDQIWKIGGSSTREQSWPQIKRRLAGAPGEKLSLVVLDGRNFKLREVQVELEAPKGPQFVVERRDGPVVHLKLGDVDFVDDRVLSRDLKQKLADNSGAPLLVDLRGVVSLTPESAVRIAGLFFPGGPVLRLATRSGREESLGAAPGKPIALPRQVFVLVDGSTAGVGEALAAVLKEKAGAVLCGRTTYALGALPEVVPLPHGGSVLLATRELQTAGGVSWSEKGLTPDKILAPQPGRLAAADPHRDMLLEDALRWISQGASLQQEAVQHRPAA